REQTEGDQPPDRERDSQNHGAVPQHALPRQHPFGAGRRRRGAVLPDPRQPAGLDFNQVVEVAKQCSEEMKKLPGLIDVEPGLNLNNPEYQVKVDRQKASDLGVRVSDVASAVRLMFSGDDEIS